MQRNSNTSKFACAIGTKSLANWKPGRVGEAITIDA
jgi:hypothetical protein